MIFRSHKNHQTTLQNIPRQSRFKLVVLGIGCALVLVGSSSLSAEDKDSNLLDSLKSRSPVKRWRKRIERKQTVDQKNQRPNILNSKDGEKVVISDRYPLILKAGIRKNNSTNIQRVSQLEDNNFGDASSEDSIIRNPDKLKKITEIQPFFDYFPGKKEGEDPCRYLCPRPDGVDCEVSDDERLECPKEVKLNHEEYTGRHFGSTVFHWEASNLKHNPLYFEDAALERYGHTWPKPVQPFVSVGKFGLQLVGLPYQMALHPVHSEQYPLGWYRPGECAPKKIYQIPLNAKAAAVEAGVVTGLIFLIP